MKKQVALVGKLKVCHFLQQIITSRLEFYTTSGFWIGPHNHDFLRKKPWVSSKVHKKQACLNDLKWSNLFQESRYLTCWKWTIRTTLSPFPFTSTCSGQSPDSTCRRSILSQKISRERTSYYLVRTATMQNWQWKRYILFECNFHISKCVIALDTLQSI